MNRKLVVLGLVLVAVGVGMVWQGVVHTRSGEPIAATTRTKASTGPETLAFGALGIGLGLWIVRRGWRGKDGF